MASKTLGQKELRTDYPFESGIEEDQKHAGRKISLEAQQGSAVLQMHRRG
jgi:hypothetical protein